LLHARKKKEKKKTTNKIEIKAKSFSNKKKTDIVLCIVILQEKDIKNVYVFIHETYLSNNECDLISYKCRATYIYVDKV